MLTRPEPEPVSITALWAAQVARAPEADAVTCDGRSMTYRAIPVATLLKGLMIALQYHHRAEERRFEDRGGPCRLPTRRDGQASRRQAARASRVRASRAETIRTRW